MVGDDARLLPVIADAAQRPLAERTGLVDAEMDPIGRHGCYPARNFAREDNGTCCVWHAGSRWPKPLSRMREREVPVAQRWEVRACSSLGHPLPGRGCCSAPSNAGVGLCTTLGLMPNEEFDGRGSGHGARRGDAAWVGDVEAGEGIEGRAWRFGRRPPAAGRSVRCRPSPQPRRRSSSSRVPSASSRKRAAHWRSDWAVRKASSTSSGTHETTARWLPERTKVCGQPSPPPVGVDRPGPRFFLQGVDLAFQIVPARSGSAFNATSAAAALTCPKGFVRGSCRPTGW